MCFMQNCGINQKKVGKTMELMHVLTGDEAEHPLALDRDPQT